MAYLCGKDCNFFTPTSYPGRTWWPHALSYQDSNWKSYREHQQRKRKRKRTSEMTTTKEGTDVEEGRRSVARKTAPRPWRTLERKTKTRNERRDRKLRLEGQWPINKWTKDNGDSKSCRPDRMDIETSDLAETRWTTRTANKTRWEDNDGEGGRRRTRKTGRGRVGTKRETRGCAVDVSRRKQIRTPRTRIRIDAWVELFRR